MSEDGIRRLADTFYAKVRGDPELARIFEHAIPGDWDPHLATMRDFWSSLMLRTGRYKGNPLAVHLRIEDLAPHLFDRWLELFAETCGELFEESVAEAFRIKAARIADGFRVASSTAPTARGHGSSDHLRRHRKLRQSRYHKT
jgi:hemoglobin